MAASMQIYTSPFKMILLLPF